MSNNARVVGQGEIGSAQYFQALAAGCAPDVRMNPVLLKPESDTRSQVIVLGTRRDDLAAIEWRARTHVLWPIVRACLDELLATHDVVVIEGAGSPAEINLQPTDIVNMRVAAAAAAATLVICDVDRGGAFAHLYGTYQLLPREHRTLIRGFVLNKFRGDPGLLAPAPQMLEAMTGVPTLAVLPLWRGHGLPEEDGVFDAGAPPRDAVDRGLHVVIVAYPSISNLDEFAPLARVPGLSLTWARDATALRSADLLILPGSKYLAGDLKWLRARGMDVGIAAHIARNGPTLAICGGLQMLGREIADPHGVEGAAMGLDLLPYTTELRAQKLYRRASHTFKRPTGFWSTLDGVGLAGYEIRHGHTWAPDLSRAHQQIDSLLNRAHHQIDSSRLVPVLEEHCGWQYGETLAIYVHGLFESPEVMRRLFGRETPTLDDTLDGLANFADRHFGAACLASLIDEAPRVPVAGPTPPPPD
jgi:adenosylcobyric acid synthase